LKRYFLHIAYKGYNYRGWQRQANTKTRNTIQEILENKFKQVFGYPVVIFGCGRTDAMVSASQYVLHIKLKEEIDFDFIFRLNKGLPHDIAILDIVLMDNRGHARFDATKRTYNYFAHFRKSPFLEDVSGFYLLENLDFKKIKQAVDLFTKYDDYYAFCRRADSYKHTICDVSVSNLYVNESQTRMRFEISANRFLRGMIRILAAQLIEVGIGKTSVDELESFLINKRADRVLDAAHPQGLYLSKIEYPYIDFPDKSNFLEPLSSGLIML